MSGSVIADFAGNSRKTAIKTDFFGGSRKRSVIPIFLLLALAACNQPRPVLILPPADLATCASEPLAPALPGKDQQAERDALVLDYLLALRAAGGDCRARVNALATWRKETAR